MKQLKYWYRKYVPQIFQKIIKEIIFFFNSIFVGYKLLYFQRSIREKARNAGLSYIASIDDDSAVFDKNLMSKFISWISYANENEISFQEKNKPGYQFYNQFPGEHYRLLSSICSIEKPKLIIDIGTYTGMSSRVFLDSVPYSKVITYDLIDWKEFDSYLEDKDFSTGRVEQKLVNLIVKNNFVDNEHHFINSDLIFLDAPKDGVFEDAFIEILSKVNFIKKTRYLIVDDIRYHEMFNFWRRIDSPKIDATALGSWCGTGIVDISNGIKLK